MNLKRRGKSVFQCFIDIRQQAIPVSRMRSIIEVDVRAGCIKVNARKCLSEDKVKANGGHLRKQLF